MSRRVVGAGLAVICCAHTVPAVGESRAKVGGVIESSITAEPVFIDPMLAVTYTDLQLTSLIHESLYRLGPDGPALGIAAAAPQWTNGKTARVSLRSALFHSGVAVTAADVVASLERARSGPLASAFEPIVTIEVDGNDVVFSTRTAMPQLEALLALPQMAILPGGLAPADTTVGAGPFIWAVQPRGTTRYVSLNAFLGHVGGRPFVDALTLRWFDASDGEARRFESGKSHVSLRGATAFPGAKPAFVSSKEESPATNLTYLGFCRRSPIAAHPAFRHGIDIGIARSGMTSLGLGEKIIPATSPVPSVMTSTVTAATTTDPTSAAAELNAAFPRIGVDTIAAPLQLLVDNSALDDREVAERVVRAIDKLGVTATIVSNSSKRFRDNVAKHSCDLYIGQLLLPFDNASLWWTQAYALGGAVRKESMASRAANFRKELPIVPLFHRGVRAWRRNDVQNLHLSSLGVLQYDSMYVAGRPQTRAAAAAVAPTGGVP